MGQFTKSGTNRKVHFWEKLEICPTLKSSTELRKGLQVIRIVVLRSLGCLLVGKIEFLARLWNWKILNFWTFPLKSQNSVGFANKFLPIWWFFCEMKLVSSIVNSIAILLRDRRLGGYGFANPWESFHPSGLRPLGWNLTPMGLQNP